MIKNLQTHTITPYGLSTTMNFVQSTRGRFSTVLVLLLFFWSSTICGQGLPSKSGGTSQTSNSEGAKIDFTSKQELKNDIQEVASGVAYRLMKCCSSYGGNNVKGNVNWDECYESSMRKRYSVIMTAGWTGSLSGNSYWIKGKLILTYTQNSDGSWSDSRTWEKIADSGGFSPGCGQSCSINE